MIPSFRHYGGKYKIRKWLISYFPVSGNKYCEVFAGKGNVYYEAFNTLKFKEWYLNDKNPIFLKTLKSSDISNISLPYKMSRSFFEEMREKRKHNDMLAILVEPRITFSGKGYPAGLDLSTIDGRTTKTNGYNAALYIERLKEGQKILQYANISSYDFQEFPYNEFGPNDFIYFDPPYMNRLYDKLPYSDIDQEKLVNILNNLNCKWAISNYDNELYNSKLNYIKFATKETFNATKNSHGKGFPVIEKLWMNYE